MRRPPGISSIRLGVPPTESWCCELVLSPSRPLKKWISSTVESPLRQLAANAGREGALIVENVKTNKNGFGYNVATDKYEDLILAGVVDPTKVTRSALQNAASIAGLLLTTECLISEKPTPPAPAGGGGHHDHDHGMGGMM
jgi:chaperonin GroEL